MVFQYLDYSVIKRRVLNEAVLTRGEFDGRTVLGGFDGRTVLLLLQFALFSVASVPKTFRFFLSAGMATIGC